MVRVGSTTFNSGGQLKRIKKIIVHTDFIMLEEQPVNDIALLHMKNKLKFNSFIKAIALPRQNSELQVGVRCRVSGWGTIKSEIEKPSVVLRATLTKILPTFQCIHIYNRLNYTVDDTMICALGKHTNRYDTDACQGKLKCCIIF